MTLPSALTNANGTLDLRAELDIAGTWTAATSLVYQRDGASPATSGTRGRPDEASQATPATSSVELNNRGGQFSPKNAVGAYFGSFGRNAPLRLSVPAQYSRLRTEADGASGGHCVNASAMAVSTTLDVQVDCDLSTWRGVIASKNGNAWELFAGSSGLTLAWWDSGGIAHSVTAGLLPPGRPGRVVLRVQLLTSGTVTFFYGPAGGVGTGPWTQLGPAISVGTTSVQTTTGNLVCGPANGDYYQVQLTTGSGTVSASPNWTAQSPGTSSFTDAQSNTWTYFGTGACDNRSYRFHGECSALPPKWDTSGNDISVPVTASGVLRRIGQGQSPVQSPMRRGVLSQTGSLTPRAYWTCEDSQDATAFGSAIGGPPLRFSQGNPPSLAQDTSFACSAALPTLASSFWTGRVPSYSGSGSIVVRFLMKLGSSGVSGLTSAWPLVRILTSGTATNLDLDIYSGYGLGISGGNSSGNVFSSGAVNFSSASPTGTLQGATLWCSLELRPSGSTVNYALVVLYPGASTGQQASGSFTGSIGNAQDFRVHAGPLTDTVIGHPSVQSDWVSLFSLGGPLSAWEGEQAADRIVRVCGENSIATRVSAGLSAPMGPQPIDTLSIILQECENADRGLLYDSRRALAVGYRTYASLCQQPAKVTLDYSLAMLGGTGTAVEPTYDDQPIRNDETVTRGTSGSSGSQGLTFQYALDDGSSMSIGQPPAGVGDYSDSQTVNVQTDAMVPDVAGWLVRVGTVDEARWPVIPLNLARSQLASVYAQLMDMDVGDYLKIINVPTWMSYDAVRQLAYGISEKLGGLHYEMELNAVPEAPWEVMLLDDAVYGHVDTDGSTLHTSVNATATSLSVSTAAGNPVWTQAAGDFPFDIAIAGERMTVTNITGSTSPQAFTVTRSVNSVVKSQSAGADVRLWHPPILALR